MKKTKTGLHIQTRKNRIEEYTQKELLAKIKKIEKTHNIKMFVGIIIFALYCVLLTYFCLLR
tara:strand:+ start:2231 stop:2416 length:186 start_codon:yes stop_codon:yes gene_type:complete